MHICSVYSKDFICICKLVPQDCLKKLSWNKAWQKFAEVFFIRVQLLSSAYPYINIQNLQEFSKFSPLEKDVIMPFNIAKHIYHDNSCIQTQDNISRIYYSISFV